MHDPHQRRLPHIQPVVPRVEALAQLLGRIASAAIQLDLLDRQRRLPPHHLHRLAQPSHTTAVRRMSCRSITACSAARYASSRSRVSKRQQRSTAGTDRPRSPAGGGTGSLPAAAPADRCPARSPRRPAPAATIRSISACVELDQRQHLRRDRARTPPGSGSAAPRHRRARAPTAAASSASVGVVNSARTSACSPRCRIRSISVTASSECPPSSKKLSCRPTRSTPQQLRPDRRQRRSRSRPAAPRTPASRTHPPSGAGSALRSSLPFGVSGSASSRTYAAGTMYSGSCAAQVRAQRLRVRAPPSRHVRTPPAACRPARPRAPPPPPRALPACSAQPRLDLAQLDPEAADLHLLVVAAQVLERPVRAASAQVARPVQPRARLAPNGSATKRSAVSSGRSR